MRNGEKPLHPRHASALLQPTLFRSTREQFVARTSVSVDEMEGWHRKGWLSFDPLTVAEYDEKEFLEVLFIKALARFGLSDAMVERLLAGLEKPYCYDPLATFYSFAEESWINLPPERDPADVTHEYVDNLVAEEEWAELEILGETISEAMKLRAQQA